MPKPEKVCVHYGMKTHIYLEANSQFIQEPCPKTGRIEKKCFWPTIGMHSEHRDPTGPRLTSWPSSSPTPRRSGASNSTLRRLTRRSGGGCRWSRATSSTLHPRPTARCSTSGAYWHFWGVSPSIILLDPLLRLRNKLLSKTYRQCFG